MMNYQLCGKCLYAGLMVETETVYPSIGRLPCCPKCGSLELTDLSDYEYAVLMAIRDKEPEAKKDES